MTNSICQHRHIGAYGVCQWNGHILLVRKARGPYTGQWDLPGGGIAFGEEPEAALRREFLEETGVAIVNLVLIRAVAHRVQYITDSGAVEDLHHLGLIYDVSLLGLGREAANEMADLPSIKSLPDGEDSGGAMWFRQAAIRKEELTPFARIVETADHV